MSKKDEGHKIDFSQIIYNLDGKTPVEVDQDRDENNQPVAGTGNDLTLGTACARALLTTMEADKNAPPEKVMLRGQLAIDIFNLIEPTGLKSEQIADIKKRLCVTWSPLIVARAFPMLDPAEATE